MKYIIEHLEKRLYTWCFLEYQHISKIVGRKNLFFANIRTTAQAKKLGKLGNAIKKSVLRLGLARAIILDPQASITLTQQDCKKAKYFIFGGILGNDPPEKRTTKHFKAMLHQGYTARNLGKKQTSTDTAVLVAHMIAHGKKLSEIPFKDGIEIDIKEGEQVILPYRYVLKNKKPILAPGMLDFLKRKGF